MELLSTSPNIDQRKLMSHLLDVLDIGSDVLVSEEEANKLRAEEAQQMQMGQDAAAMAQPAPMAPPGGGDTMAGCGMPPMTEAIPVEAQGAMAGGAGMATPDQGLM